MEIYSGSEDVVQSYFEDWYQTFKKYSIKSRIVDLTPEFIAYLLEDGIFLPSRLSTFIGNDELSDDGDNYSVEDDSDTGDRFSNFSSINAQISRAIEILGDVFIKLDGKAPTDASWMNGGSLKCSNLGQIYLLLKSSVRISESLQESNAACKLILRKWSNLHPGMEFRCFLIENKLRGICQRDCR